MRGFKHSFSAYIAWLIDRDANGSVEREAISTQARRQRAKTRTAA